MKKILFYVFSFFLLQIGNINDALAVTYRLQRVTNVKAGEKYVFEQAGRVMNNTISKYALETTNSYKTYGLTGDEGYVWTTIYSAKEEYIIRYNSSTILSNPSGTYLMLSNKTTNSAWQFNFGSNETVVIYQGNSVKIGRAHV